MLTSRTDESVRPIALSDSEAVGYYMPLASDDVEIHVQAMRWSFLDFLIALAKLD